MKNIFILCYIMRKFIFNYFVIPNKEFIFARYNGIIIASLLLMYTYAILIP